ncbi:ATP-binding protein [Sinorhizobium meliloti]|uniref:ATP-binding protein n=1 Tax=Rhizobium meliloti TaxID=382 RepID=UPI003F5CE44D
MQFLGRERELKLVRTELDSQRPSLIIVFGRRRIGKSRFLREAAKNRPEIYFQATRVSSLLNLEQFKSDVGKAIGCRACRRASGIDRHDRRISLSA